MQSNKTFNQKGTTLNLKIRLFLVFIFLLSNCENKKPVFFPELTESYQPIEGILPYFKSENLDPYWTDNNNYPQDLRKITDLSLTSNKNQTITEKELLGKYKLIIFFYARCNGVCPMITRNMQNFLPRIKNLQDLEIISITINPEIDTVEVINEFRKNYGIKEKNWLQLTGNKNQIYNLARRQFGADIQTIKGKEDLTDFVHTENVYLVDKKNFLRGIYRAKGTGDLERLLVEMETLRKSDSLTDNIK